MRSTSALNVHAHLPPRKRVQYRIEYVVVKTMLSVCGRVPLRVLRRVGSFLGSVAYRVFQIRRAIVIDNISRSFPEVPPEAVDRIALEAYKNTGRCFLEMSAMGLATKSDILGSVTIEGMQRFDEALAHGRGAILYSGHFGNWEWLGAVIGRCGYPIHATDTNHSNKLVHKLITRMRKRQGMAVLAPDVSLSELQRLLRNNKMITYVADQDARRDGIFVDFLGRPASTLRGPALLAVRVGCPILPGFLIREGVDRHRAVFEQLLWPDPSLPRSAAVLDLTQRFTILLERYVRAYPEMYFWMHRRWKTVPAA
jgi:KDO2-lipid IV(A) lauroyltransferase